jgi:hypothetical protein
VRDWAANARKPPIGPLFVPDSSKMAYKAVQHGAQNGRNQSSA